MDIIDISTVKEYLRIDGDYDDMLLKHLIKSAESYLYSTIDNLANKLHDDTVRPLASLAVLMLVKESYDNRDGKDSKIPNNVSRLIQQLQLTKVGE